MRFGVLGLKRILQQKLEGAVPQTNGCPKAFVHKVLKLPVKITLATIIVLKKSSSHKSE